MTLSQPNPSTQRGRSSRYLRPPAPLHFPVGESVPEGTEHLLQVVALWECVTQALGDGALVSSDQFLYWDPTDPKKCLAPDLAVRMATPAALLKTWKTWEHGAPHLGVEIVSDSDRGEGPFARKLERYRQAGVAEVVRFDADDLEQPLRLWDLLDGDLVERDLASPERRYCDALGLYWCIVTDPLQGPMLRLARDATGAGLLPTPAETRDAERAAKDAALAAKDAALAAKDAALAAKDAALAAKDVELSAKEAALARVAELEAELSRKR